jgi:phospholipase/lecithinase/hemolysin
LVTVLAVAGCQPTTIPQPSATTRLADTPQSSATATAKPTLPPPTITATSTAVPSPTATPIPKITYIYAFGDDYSDNGASYKAAKEAFEKKELSAETMDLIENNLVEGRWSNGLLAVEVLANLLNAGLTDYALAMATTGYGSLDNNKDGILWQIDQFISDLKGQTVDAGALFFIAGGRDLGKHFWAGDDMSDEAITAYADEAVANISTAITRLAEAGAKQFLIGGAFDWANQPVIGRIKKNRGIDVHQSVTLYQSRIRSTLPGVMDELAGQLKVKISVFDFIAAEERIRSNASQYAFTNLTDPCTNILAKDVKVCESPDEYYYWGADWYTHRVHQIWAEMMADQLSK